MIGKRIPDQPYPDLREVLDIFVSDLERELSDNLVGVYLVGSLATGDFDADSDVDFLVVIGNELSESHRDHLQQIQEKMYEMDSYPAKHLEGSYISIHDLHDWSTVGKKAIFYFDNGSTTPEFSVHDNNWHVRWVLRERGIVLAGPEPHTILTPIPRDNVRYEMKTTMRQILTLYEHAITQPVQFLNSQFGQSFLVLTYCRMLHTIHTGEVRSKKAGAEWAVKIVAPEWRGLIDQAWKDREGVRFGLKIQRRADDQWLMTTLEFMKYAIALAETEQ